MAKTFTGFGLRDVAIAARLTSPGTPVWIDIPAVESAAFKLDVSEVEQYGDDQYLGSYYHSQKGTVTVKATQMATAVLELITGNVISSSGGNESQLFGSQKELVPPRVSLRGIVPIRNSDGTTGTMTIYWYECDVKTAWDSIPGSERAKLMEVNLVFASYSTTRDHNGQTIPGGQSAFGHWVA